MYSIKTLSLDDFSWYQVYTEHFKIHNLKSSVVFCRLVSCVLAKPKGLHPALYCLINEIVMSPQSGHIFIINCLKLQVKFLTFVAPTTV